MGFTINHNASIGVLLPVFAEGNFKQKKTQCTGNRKMSNCQNNVLGGKCAFMEEIGGTAVTCSRNTPQK